jgi:DNA-binding NarL/FixJ family response regulator
MGGLGLTQKELDILNFLRCGTTRHEIAGRLNISNNTVKTHISNIYNKLNATNNAHAIDIAYRLGILKSEDPE